MPVLVREPYPPEFEALLELRRQLGQNLRDEVWNGVLHMASPNLSPEHMRTAAVVLDRLAPLARAQNMTATADLNIADGLDNFRVPDGGLVRAEDPVKWVPTAALVLEVVAPGDETWEKLPFYAAHGVDEVVVVDPARREIHWLSLSGGAYGRVAQSGLIILDAPRLAVALGWISGRA